MVPGTGGPVGGGVGLSIVSSPVGEGVVSPVGEGVGRTVICPVGEGVGRTVICSVGEGVGSFDDEALYW